LLKLATPATAAWANVPLSTAPTVPVPGVREIVIVAVDETVAPLEFWTVT